jgi:type I restriction enzyme M protein
MSLTTTIKTIQDIMRKDVGVDGDAQRMGQLVWMLFLKILDEQEKKIEQIEEGHISPIKEEFRWRNWAAVDENEQKTGDQLIEFVNSQLFSALKDVHSYQGNGKLPEVIQSVFEDAYNYMKSGTLLRQVINKIEEDIPLESFEDQKHLGDVYEKLLKDLQSAGNAGEYYTPRAVTEFIVDRIGPRIGETILDPACGTGGFLAQAVDYLNKNKQESNETLQKIQDASHGIEKKPLPHMLAVTNMILHGIKEPFRIERKNTLDLYKAWPEDRRVDIVMTNPPFGGMEEEGIEKQFPIEFRTRETADLFIYFIYSKMLKNGGRCAIVLPDGFLFGGGIKNRIKEELMETCNFHTIVRLPNGVFSPYTGINTNILFFEKTDKEKDCSGPKKLDTF